MLVKRNFLTSQIYKQTYTNSNTQTPMHGILHTCMLTYYTHKTLTIVLIERISEKCVNTHVHTYMNVYMYTNIYEMNVCKIAQIEK